MTSHPGRRAVLHLAACDTTITDERRLNLVRIVFGTEADEKAILTGLDEARGMHTQRRHADVAAVLSQLLTDHIPKET